MCDAYTCGEQASSVGILEGLQRMPQEMRNTFDVIQSCSGTEWFILIVPAGAGKGSAALHVASRLGMSGREREARTGVSGYNDAGAQPICTLGVYLSYAL